MKGQEVFDKYLEIKQDLINNLGDIFNRQHTYTHKYRGNLLTDINVGLDITEDRKKIIQIFVRHDNMWIRDRLIFDSKGYFESNIKTNLKSYE